MTDINDNFLSDEPNETEQTIEEKIKLGNTEYSQDELLQKIGLADKISELESKYNTKLDSVWPEYGRSQNRVKELEAEVEKMKTQPQPEATQEFDEETRKKAIEQAKALGLLTRDDGYLTPDQARELWQQERQTEKLVERLEGLEKEINGQDGRPKFDKVGVLEYMRDNGVRDPVLAYKMKNESALDQWKMTEVGRAKSRGLYTTNASHANKQPAEVKPNKDNLNQLVNEALEGLL